MRDVRGSAQKTVTAIHVSVVLPCQLSLCAAVSCCLENIQQGCHTDEFVQQKHHWQPRQHLQPHKTFLNHFSTTHTYFAYLVRNKLNPL